MVALGKGSRVEKLLGYSERTRCMYSANNAISQVENIASTITVAPDVPTVTLV